MFSFIVKYIYTQSFNIYLIACRINLNMLYINLNTI